MGSDNTFGETNFNPDMIDQKELISRLKKLGFKFTQPEFCNKGKFYVCTDCYPYLAEFGDEKELWFESWADFKRFYNKNK